MLLLLVLVSCGISISMSGDEPSPPPDESRAAPVPFGHDPYLDGQPPRFLWHYPPPPEGLIAIPLGEDGVMLEWQPVYGAAGYDVLHYLYSEGVVLTPENSSDPSLRSETYAIIGELLTSQTSHQVSDLECEQTYLFEVRAVGAGRPVDMSTEPAQTDYGSPSRVIVSPCGTGLAISDSYAGLCPEEGTDCLLPSQKVALSSGWPPFQAIYSALYRESWRHYCVDAHYYDSRWQVKHMDYRSTYDYRITVIGDFEWKYPEVRCSGSGRLYEGVGSYEEQTGLIRTSYNALDYSGRVERSSTLGLPSTDFTDNLRYLERVFGKDHPAALIAMGIYPEEGVERFEGTPEDYDGVCYRNVCESENAAMRFGDDLVTNDEFQIPLVLGTLDRVDSSLRVHRIWIDADRTP